MAAKKSSKAVAPRGRTEKIAAMRQKIDEAEVLEALIIYATGGVLPLRDELGNVVGFTERLDNSQRLQVLTHLSNKTLPHLNASSVDLTSAGEGGIRLILAEGVVPPRSGEVPRDVTPQPDAIDHKPTIDTPIEQQPTGQKASKQ